MAKAAGGDAKSLREMASRSHEAAEGRSDMTGLICLAEALTFARLAASLGSVRAKGNAVTILYDMADCVFAAGDLAQANAFKAQALELQGA